MPMSDEMAQNLGKLINEVNPYTENKEPLRGGLTGSMDIYTGTATTADGYADAKAGDAAASRSQIRLETDTKYQGEWIFKGQPHRIGKSVRIRYRFPVKDGPGDEANILYWTEDYLLLGFEGSNSG